MSIVAHLELNTQEKKKPSLKFENDKSTKIWFLYHSSLISAIGVRAIFCQGGGGEAVNHLPKKFLQVAQIFTEQSTETRADATT